MVDLKLLEDLVALEQTGSFVRAAERRHVTHPAFGRRIKALESWAGAPLVERQRIPVRLTPQGEALLRTGSQMLEQMEQVRHRLRSTGPAADPVLRVATGRSLARTLVADWIVRLRRKPRPVLAPNSQVDLTTGRVNDLAALLEGGKTDLLCAYAHSAITELLSPARYRYLTLAADKLVPVSQVDRRGRPRFGLSDSPAAPLIAYVGGLALERILGDRLEARAYALRPFLRCDSPDAAHGAALKGLGVAWLPWSMVAGDCRRGALAVLGGRGDEIVFEVRMYRSRQRLSDVAEAAWALTESGH
ncbi:LysR family transcriptional regulator [Achromobacter sp. GG226]|uniref:LysR family transcriptional regulator n=1 Tax=Verticiella alkaliphila TaxID=2779529 RepID=UPI001C0D3C94|nr:LysR family transcriptional regulator [Verticiella sp. GG226]MBU4610804.1 LysR family transcriptional regulator [Verticiella sp. GG226]